MGKLTDKSVLLNFFQMHNLPHFLWLAISVSTLAILSSYPVLAKPQSPAKVIATSHLSKKVSVSKEISPPPVEAVLASLKLNPSLRSKGVNSGLPNKVTNSSQATNSRNTAGISNLTNTDLSTNVSPVDRLIK
jgi:hypothetical protein